MLPLAERYFQMVGSNAKNIIAALTGVEGRASKRSLLVRPSASGPVPSSGAPGATGQGAGRSQRRDSRRRQSPGTLRIRSKTGGKRSLPARLSAESAGCEALRASRPVDDIRSVVVGREAARLQRKPQRRGFLRPLKHHVR
jgi:hypothetical protein